MTILLMLGILSIATNSVATEPPYVSTPAIGDFVWNDLDADGIQDVGESGIPGVRVNLYWVHNSIEYLWDFMDTDSAGFYVFQDLDPGNNYYIEFILPEGYEFSPQDQGSDDSVDSDADPLTGKTTLITALFCNFLCDWDAGMYEEPVIELAAIGDLVWYDLDVDGIQDEGEAGVAGVTVHLYDGIGTPLASMVTDGNGNYLFTDLIPGDYQVGFVLPEGYLFSPQDQGTDDAIDSDADLLTGLAAVTNLAAGEVDLTWDAGIYEEPTGEFEGHTPGYWKRHTDEWVGYSPGQILDDVFDFPPGELESLAVDTLLTALKYGGGKGIIGKAKNLLRAAVAAVISTAHPEINYPLSLAEVIDAVNVALASLDPVVIGDLQKELDKYNNLGVS